MNKIPILTELPVITGCYSMKTNRRAAQDHYTGNQQSGSDTPINVPPPEPRPVMPEAREDNQQIPVQIEEPVSFQPAHEQTSPQKLEIL